MSSILNYKFYLNFKNEGSFGRIEITEPVAFDGASFIVEQESKRYGRDVYRINEEIDFSFNKGNFDTGDLQQTPNGTVIFNLTQGFDWLVEVYKEHKYEANVDFEIELNGILFVPANLDFQTCETDDYTYFNCKALQEQSKQLVKRRSDVVTDLFGTEDLDGNEIEPIETFNILQKSKPITEVANWSTYEEETIFTSRTFVGGLFEPEVQTVRFGGNSANNLINYSDSSVTFISTSTPLGIDLTPNTENFVYLNAAYDLTNINIEITNIDANVRQTVTNYFDDKVLSGSGFARLVVLTGLDVDNIENEYILWQRDFEYEDGDDNPNSEFFDIPTSFSLTVPSLETSKRLYIFFQTDCEAELDYSIDNTLVNYQVRGTINNMDVSIKAISTAIDTVFATCRYIDVIKANVERINGFEVYAPKLDVGGVYYNNSAQTSNMIKGRAETFPVRFKDLMEGLQELNMDYQVLSDKIYIGQYKDFYPNKEIGAFLSSPDTSFKKTSNERYTINTFEMSYDVFEQDRDEENTTDAIHTQSEWMTSNKQVENKKEVKIKPYRDAFKFESVKKLGLKETTSTNDDDKIGLLDILPLAPSVKGGFNSVLLHNVNEDGNVQLLATEQFRWTLIGVTEGADFEIILGENVGEYIILEFSDSVITLEPQGFVPTFTGSVFTEVEFPYSNVFWTNRTNEELVFAENLLNSDNFANLKYSIKRNMETWKPYLATASIAANGTLRNTYFKDNGSCITRFSGESENIQENANIDNVDLGDAFLTPFIYETRLLVPYNEMRAVLDAINTINEDDTIGGFIRCIDNNGKVIKLYPKKLEYVPSTETLTMTGEERYEGDGVNIVINGDNIIVNKAGYDESQLSEVWYEFDGDYFKIYDIDKLPIINPTRYDFITVDGQTFDSSIDLLGYLVNL
jgi:hypothetical protein